MGAKVPFWDSRDEFGDTTLIVAKPGGRRFAGARARAALDGADAPPRRHRRRQTSLEKLTFRTIYTARNAAMQIQAHTLGFVSPLNAAETALAGEYNLRPGPVARAWEYWSVRLDKAEGTRRASKPKGNGRRNGYPNARQKQRNHASACSRKVGTGFRKRSCAKK